MSEWVHKSYKRYIDMNTLSYIYIYIYICEREIEREREILKNIGNNEIHQEIDNKEVIYIYIYIYRERERERERE